MEDGTVRQNSPQNQAIRLHCSDCRREWKHWGQSADQGIDQGVQQGFLLVFKQILKMGNFQLNLESSGFSN